MFSLSLSCACAGTARQVAISLTVLVYSPLCRNDHSSKSRSRSEKIVIICPKPFKRFPRGPSPLRPSSASRRIINHRTHTNYQCKGMDDSEFECVELLRTFPLRYQYHPVCSICRSVISPRFHLTREHRDCSGNMIFVLWGIGITTSLDHQRSKVASDSGVSSYCLQEPKKKGE